MEDLLKSEDIFVDKVSSFDQGMLRKLYDAIFDLKTINRSVKQMVFKLKRIIKATVTMTTSLVLDEAIESIVEEICECLDCERATTFIYDNSKEELWSKAAKGSDETIRVPLGKGIVGKFIFQNIMDWNRFHRTCICKRGTVKYNERLYR